MHIRDTMMANGESTFEEFIRLFLRTYGEKQGPLAILNEVLRTTMSNRTIQNKSFDAYVAELSDKAHQAYEGLRVAKEHWNTLDRVIVGGAFVFAAPKELSAHLIMTQSETLEEIIAQSRLWCQAHDSKSRPNNALVANANDARNHGQGRESNRRQGGRQNGYDGNQSQGGSQQRNPQRQSGGYRKIRDFLCSKCRAIEPTPPSCNHSRRCFQTGHTAAMCQAASPAKEQ